MPPTDPDCTKSKSHGNICSKNHCDTSEEVDIQELLSNNSKYHIDNCDISQVDEVTWTEEMPPTDLNCTKSKSHDNNYDKSSCNGDKVGGKERGSDNLEGLE